MFLAAVVAAGGLIVSGAVLNRSLAQQEHRHQVAIQERTLINQKFNTLYEGFIAQLEQAEVQDAQFTYYRQHPRELAKVNTDIQRQIGKYRALITH